MTAPLFTTCDDCGMVWRQDILGAACPGCGRSRVVVVEHQAVEQSAPASPIIGRKVFRSASLRDPARVCPLLLKSAEKSTI